MGILLIITYYQNQETGFSVAFGRIPRFKKRNPVSEAIDRLYPQTKKPGSPLLLAEYRDLFKKPGF
jgi:hypothetical protein